MMLAVFFLAAANYRSNTIQSADFESIVESVAGSFHDTPVERGVELRE